MLHSRATAQVSLAALPSGAVLRGPARPDLIRDELLCEIFAATVASRPSAIAMITVEGNLTYAEVDAKAEALARGLLQKGVRPGHSVGLWMPRGHELLIAQIAIAKTGAAWLPFDADAPPKRVAVCLSDADARGLLSSASFAAKLTASCPAWTFAGLLADFQDTADPVRIDARALGARPEHPAYLIYTSGSTGTPKGIVIIGRNICHYLRAANEVYGMSPAMSCSRAPPSPSICRWKKSGFLTWSARAFSSRRAEMMGEADKLPDLLEANRVTVLDTVPTLLGMPAARRRDLAR